MPKGEKRKTGNRFHQFNHYVDQLSRALPTNSHRWMITVAFRHADVKGRFSMSISQLGQATFVSRRQAVRLVQDLKDCGALRVIREATGTRPPVYMICFNPMPSGDTGDTASDY